MSAETSHLWNEPLVVELLLYLAVFGFICLLTVGISLLARQRAAAGWMVLLSALATLGVYVYNEYIDVPLPPPPVEPAPQARAPEPAPEPPPTEPEPAAEPEPALKAKAEPQKPRPVRPYALKFLERDVQQGSSQARYYAQGPTRQGVEELIFGDSIESAIWEFSITGGYEKFPPDWKKTLHENVGRHVRITSKNHDKRGWKLRAVSNLGGVREGLLQLGFTTEEVRPRFRIERNPTTASAPDLAQALTEAALRQSHYSLGRHLLTNASLFKDELGHLNFLFGGVRYFIDVSNAEEMGGDGRGLDVLYTVSLTPGASD